jgi:hypothetical protein
MNIKNIIVQNVKEIKVEGIKKIDNRLYSEKYLAKNNVSTLRTDNLIIW